MSIWPRRKRRSHRWWRRYIRRRKKRAMRRVFRKKMSSALLRAFEDMSPGDAFLDRVDRRFCLIMVISVLVLMSMLIGWLLVR